MLDGPAAAAVTAGWATLSEAPSVLVHYAFWPGNVLWSDEKISGVADWPGAVNGPAGFDVGGCRHDCLPRMARRRHHRQRVPRSGNDYSADWTTCAETVRAGRGCFLAAPKSQCPAKQSHTELPGGSLLTVTRTRCLLTPKVNVM
jgi:aminoglycoside phosphotransferase (APT) family kinase protein